jgi:hypothetical protein
MPLLIYKKIYKELLDKKKNIIYNNYGTGVKA